jgi:hypothetical protein
VSGITASRLALGAALEAAGLRVAYDPGLVVPPAILVAATDPWVTPSGLATLSRSIRWRLVAVAGRADVTVTVENLEDLVAATLVAVARLKGWGTPTYDSPGTVTLAGADYLAAVGRVDHWTEV